MDINSNIPEQKKVVSVEILHLDELGYGPQGKHTRREWRAECLENLLAGKEQFEAWQNSWKDQIDETLPEVILGYKLRYDDGKSESVMDEVYSTTAPTCLDFVAHIFAITVDANNFEFKSPANFSGAMFKKYANFKFSKFYAEAKFTNAQFNDSASFEGCMLKTALFENTNFGGHLAKFDYCQFDDFARFEGANFPNQFMPFFIYTSFTKTIFNKGALFKNVNFRSDTYFNDAKFFGPTDFENSNFEQGINFENVTFGIETEDSYPKINFIKCRFSFDAKFSGSKFLLPTYFIDAQYGGDAEFNKVTFTKDVRFFGTIFKGGSFFNDAIFKGDAAKKLGQMKRMAEDSGQTDQALNFNALELDAKLKQSNTNGLFKLFTLLYKIFSDYGRSFGRPMFWYGVLICLSAILAMAYSTYSESPAEGRQALCKQIKDQPPPLKLSYGQAVVEYAMFRAGGLMDFTDTGKQNNAVNCRLFEEPIEPPLMRAWGIFKGIASIALLFLAALGLRNKYRIK